MTRMTTLVKTAVASFAALLRQERRSRRELIKRFEGNGVQRR